MTVSTENATPARSSKTAYSDFPYLTVHIQMGEWVRIEFVPWNLSFLFGQIFVGGCFQWKLSYAYLSNSSMSREKLSRALDAATHCNTLHFTATHCNTLQYTATHCNTLQHKLSRALNVCSYAGHGPCLNHISAQVIWPFCISARLDEGSWQKPSTSTDIWVMAPFIYISALGTLRACTSAGMWCITRLCICSYSEYDSVMYQHTSYQEPYVSAAMRVRTP